MEFPHGIDEWLELGDGLLALAVLLFIFGFLIHVIFITIWG